MSTPTINEAEVDKIMHSIWDAAARINPQLLAKLRPDYKFKRLREMISDCLEKGLTPSKTHDHCLRELLQSAAAGRQPHDDCDDAATSNQLGGGCV
jgi:hypothetical protein